MAVTNPKGSDYATDLTRYNRSIRQLRSAIKTRNAEDLKWAIAGVLAEDLRTQKFSGNPVFRDLLKLVGKLELSTPPVEEDDELDAFIGDIDKTPPSTSIVESEK